MTRQRRAVWELVGASVFWGFGFVAAVWALDGFGPFLATGIRFAITFLISIFAMPKLGAIKEARALGFWLAAMLALQTWGLQYTTATKSAFITVLYIVIVPLLERWVWKKKGSLWHYVFVTGALVGIALLSEVYKSSEVSLGDALTFLCAIAAAVHICLLSEVAPKTKNAFSLNTWQCFWGMWPLLIIGFFVEKDPVSLAGWKVWAGMGALILFSSLLAFTLQVRAQRHLSARTSSLIFLLELPFGALFAFVFLGERLNAMQWVGAVILVSTLVTAIFFETKKEEVLTSDAA